MESTPSSEEKQAVKRYLIWYIENINSDDEDSINGAGTMYDYEIDITKAGKEKSISKESYDSVDSYASTFLKAVSDYVLSLIHI